MSFGPPLEKNLDGIHPSEVDTREESEGQEEQTVEEYEYWFTEQVACELGRVDSRIIITLTKIRIVLLLLAANILKTKRKLFSIMHSLNHHHLLALVNAL